MRITDLSLRFLDGKQIVEGYSTPGWYLLAPDADTEGQLWAVRPVKIVPDQAESIAEAVGPRAAAGVRTQNEHARDQAEEAARRAERLATEATARAAELATWDQAVCAASNDDATRDPR